MPSKKTKLISKKSRLKTLVPLLDEDGLTRCDGRLRFAEFLPYAMRFPIERVLELSGPLQGCWKSSQLETDMSGW